MLRVAIRLSLVLFVLNQLCTPCSALRGSSNRGGGKYDRGYQDPSKPKSFGGTSPGLPPQNPTRRGLGISAWGIILLVVALILAGTGCYYFSICYPTVCMKNNKYDMMALPTKA